MAQNDNIGNLYDLLKKAGYNDIGTDSQFRSYVSDANNVKKLHGLLQEAGYNDIGDEDAFMNYLGVGQQTAKAAEIQQPTQQAQPKQQGGYKPTEQEMMAYGMTAGQAKGTAANATKGIENLQEGIKKASPVGDVSAGVGHNTNVRKGKQSFNAETGKFEDTYMTTDGQQYKNAIQADNAQGYLDRQKNFHQLQDAIGLDDLGDTGRSVDDRLKDAYNERKFLDYEINKRGEQLNEESRKHEREKGLGQRILEGFVGAEKGDVQDFSHVDDSEYQNLQSAKRLLDRRITALEAEKNNSGFWRGTWDELKDPSNYSFGLTDLSDAAGMQRIKAKLDSGASLTSGEKTLVRNYLMNQDAQQLDNNRDWWYGAGKGFGQTLSFMKDFALTGGGFANIAKAGMRTGGKIGTNVATKALGEYMTKNLGTKVLGKTMEYIGKGAGLAAGAEAGGFLLNNSVQAASSTADIINKNLGKLTINKDGKLDFEEGKSLGNAILQSEISRTGENASELVGLGFDAMPGILGRVIQKTAAGKIAKRIADNKIWKGWEKGMNYLGVQSVWGEGLEEEYNMARTEMLNQLTDGTFEPNGSGLFDWEQQLDTWKTVGLTSMILRVPSMVVSGVDGANYYGNKYNLNTSDRQMRSTFGDESRYNAVKSMLDGADNQKIAGVLNSLMNNAELSTDEKKATMMYANDLIALRGFNIGNVVAAANGYKAPPKVANYSIRGLHVDEIDREGNVINSYDYENADALKSGLYELQQQRYDNNLQSDISVMKARPNGQYDAMVKDFCEQAGIDPEEFDTILSKPSLERTEAEQQMVAPFADLLHNTVYDNTMLHEEQSQQDGEEMADSDSIDIETDNHNGATLNAQWQEAQGVRQQMFDNNEILKEEVESMEKNGLSPQEILSRIEPSASPKEVQGMIDYYNTKAKYEGYINRKAEKIDEEAANSRQRHTFKGTIDGVADVNNVHTITDGTNRYFLVSGNVTTDPATGNITGSSSGLIIGMDLDGSFVQLNEDDGYRIEPVTESLDQFEDAERTRLQEQVTSVIDPNGTMAPAGQPTGQTQQKQQGGSVGAEAGADGTGANETPTPAPVVGGEAAQQPAGETAGTAATIESVTGEDGVKRYEQGVDMDTAIQDMEADGLDVKSEADLAINEAQEELGKIKAPKTRAERVKNEARRRELQGIVDYYSGLKARYDELHPNYADATPFIDQLNKATSKKKADEILNQALQAGVNPVEVNPVHSQRVSDILAKEEETRRRQTEITDADRRSILENGGTSEGRAMLLDKKRVPSAEKRRKLAKEIYGDYFDDDFDAWRDVKELISMWLGKGRQLDPDSFGQALGWDMGVGKDAAKVSTMFAKRRENGGDGMLFNDFVHMLWEASEGRIEDDRDISNAVIDMFQSAQEKSDLTEYQLQNRIAEAEARIADELRAAEEEAGQKNEEETETPVNEGILPFAPPSENEEKPAFLSDNNIGFDRQGNPVGVDGKLIVEKVSSIDDISNEDFENPARTIELPKLPEIVNNAIGANGKPVIIKKNIFERNKIAHSDLTPEQSRDILKAALYTPDLYGQNQKTKRPYNWVVISTKGADGNNRLVLLEINENKDNVEIVHWHYLRDEALETLKRQAEREGGQILILPSNEEAGGLSSRTFGMSSDGKDSENSDKLQEKEQKSLSREDYLTSHPLTEAQIMADTEATEDEKLNAIDFLRGEDNSAISRFYYDGIYNRAQGAAEIQQPTEQQPIETNNPMEAIEQAANSFKEGKAAEVPLGEHGTLVIGGVPKREAQKAQDQKDIDAALKEFNGFLDGAKGSNVLDKFMRKGIEGNDKAQANLIDAFTLTNEAQRMFLKDLLRLASKVGYAYIKSGVHDAQDWSKKMADSIGKKLKEVLGWDDGIVGEFVDEVWNQKYTVDGQRMRLSEHAERLKNDKAVNVNKEKSDEEKKDVTLQEEAAVVQQQTGQLEGDSAEFSERQYKIEQLSKKIKAKLQGIVNWGDQPKPLSAYKKIAEELGLKLSDTDLQELIETEVVNMAREISNKEGLTDEKKFEKIVKLYESQPTLSARDNDRINKQQYSTPAPMAFLMGKFLGPAITDRESWRGLEPSAGNGMLTINLPKEGMHVNDIDEMRLSNLQKQGFGEVTSQDALMPFDGQYDVVVTNPPFGSVTPKVYDGIYEISGLEHQMAINALESMKDDGRAAIIIGGNTDYNTNGSIKGKDRIFLNYLYAHYNVVDVINMNGHALYSRQGTGYPVRMILIDGRKEFDPKSFAPVQSKARAERVESYDELYKRVNDDILRNKEHNGDTSNGVHTAESGQNGGLSDKGNAGTSNETGVRGVRGRDRNGEHQLPTEPVGDVQRSDASTEAREGEGTSQPGGNGGVVTRPILPNERGNQPEQSGGSEAVPSGNEGGEVAVGGGNTQRLPGNAVDSGARLSVEQPEQKRELGTEKVPYRKQSTNPFDLQSQMPAEQADVVKKALEDLGDVDQFLVDELGYSSKEELHQALAAEQIDSVALAIHQMKNGDAFIIGDQTGIGKGRQGAALIRWAVKNGKAPVYFTAKPELFSSVYRDIKDIHSDGLRPFILASDKVKARITERNKEGKDEVLYDLPSDKEQKRVLDYINKNGKLPPEYDFMITTYSQVGNGTLDYENGQKKARSYGRGKSATKADINGQSKRDAIENLAGSSIVIMDESHLAGGASARGNYLQYITTKASGITYISATFAKRPDNMPLYSLRTAISKAGVEIGELIEAVKRGGATFQEIMSKALTEAGQMIRRERDMRGVSVDWKGIEDEEVIKKHYEQYDKIVGLFNDIISFQRTYVDPIVNGMNDDAADAQGAVDHTPGTRDMGINNTPFASQTHNLVKQVLLSLKAEEGAKFAVECLKNKEKPVICVENTNEGAADRAVGSSEEEDMVMPDLSTNLQKGLEGTLRIQTTDAFGNKTQSYIPLSSLPEEGQRRYHEIEEAIENSSTGLSLSPIDVIKNVIRQAGYSVAELTGRKKEFIFNPDGTVKRVNRTDTDNKKNAADFNSGKVDAVIINKSAGTGIDLHAGIKFDNTDQRHMITVQAQSDINDEVQMRGRTDRTGQKQHSKYTYIVSTIPSEQRLLMMLKSKLRSLDANTTSSQKSKFNEMQVQDIINKYGDDIVVQYLAEHPDTYAKLADPLKWGDTVFDTPAEALIASAQRPTGDGATASKVLGRMALLKVKEQEEMLADITELYQAEIDRLNEMGENDLEITEMPLRAKTLSKAVWEQGLEPGGKNPFADNTYVEKVSMDVLKKPMKADEVKKAQERLLRPAANATGVVATWEDYKERTLEKVDKWAADKIAETRKTFTERAEKKANAEKEKYAKAAKKNQAKNGMTDAEIEKNADIQYDNIYNQEMEKLNDALAAIEAQKQVFVDALEMFSTDGVYAIPSNIYDLGGMTFEPSFGKLIDIKISDNFSTAASTITFATLDGRRKITIPINGMVKQQNGEKRSLFPVINTLTAQTKNGMFGSNVANTLKVLGLNVDNWDKLTSTATRKEGHIITGNLLRALVSTREQGVGGKLISFTTDTGEVRQGILMPDNFDPSKVTSKTPISSVKKKLDNFEPVVSADGNVVLKNTKGIDWINTKPGRHTEWIYSIQVPKSKKNGEKFYNDDTLLGLMDGQFEGSTYLRATFPLRNLDAVLKRLDELGVTVADGHKEDGSKLQVYDTADPMEAIAAAAEQWRAENEEKLNNQAKQSNNRNNSVSLPKNKRYGKERAESSRSGRGGLERSDTADALPRRTQRILDRVAKQLGITIKVDDREADADSGGKWNSDTRTITLSVDTANDTHRAIMKVFGHELTHAIKQMSAQYPEVWDAFVGVIKERIGEAKWKELFDSYRKSYDKAHDKRKMQRLDDAGIEEEICADVAGEGIFTDEQFVKDLIDRVDREGGDVQSFIDRMLDFIKDIIDRIKAVLDATDSATIRDEVTLNVAREIWSDMYQYAAEKQIAEQSQERLSVITDQNLIDRLEKEPKITVYRAMQLKDGNLYPPMAARVNGKWQDPLPLGVWSQADEHPELVDENGKFDLDKGNGKKVAGVVYAPYMHGSTTMLNDQFKEAQDRPELVVVEAEMPKSELTSGYQAEKSPRKTGMLDWKAGTIQGQLTGTRQVMLSRWVKPTRIVPSSEVAANIKQMIDGQVDVMPTNVVTPEQREELEKLGVKFVKTNNKEIIQEGEHKGEQYSDAYGKKSKKKPKSQPKERLSVNVGVDPMDAIRNAADTFRRGRDNASNEANSPEYSAKQVYHDRINNKTFVTTEAFQDAMLSLKNAVNAIAKDKDIPDSQNPYMAENLMHGKVKNQMDEFNRNYKDPLMETIKKIIRETGVNYGDIDRYVYTKSGLERNREFFVRDWLEKERKRVIGGYEELNEQEQEIYDKLANAIETKFEDGDITAEQRDGQLEQALQEAHDRYINDLEQEWLRVKRSAFGKLNNGEIDYRGYLTALRDFIVANLDEKYKPEKNDYSGFRDMFGDEKGKYDEGAIIDEVEKFEGADGIGSDETVQTLWNQIREVNRYSLERYREAGMRSDEQIDQIEQMFNFYVPMRGFAKETGEDVYQYMTNPDENGVRHLGGLLKHAVGRKSEAEYPIATMFAMAYKTISDCEQNLVNQKLYRLVQANPNDLIVLSDSWAVLNERTGMWEESMPDIPEDATEEEARRITLDWEEEMKELAKEGKAKKIKGTPKFDYIPIDPKKKAEHVVEVRMNGKKKLMTVTGNPRLAQALNGQLRFKGALGKVSSAYAKVKNFMASTFTSWSPTFAMRNMFRDWTHFRMMLSVREGEEYARAANKYYKETLPRPYHGKKDGEKKEGMVELFKKYRAGTLDMNKEVERDFKDFMDSGGITGFVFMQKLKDVEKEIEGLTKDMKTEATIGYGKYSISFKKPKGLNKVVALNDKTFKALFDTIEAYNEAVENNARFATFRASRHVAGRTKQRSAYDAKEITVNFNRKGAGINTAGFKSNNKDVELAAQMAGVTSQVLGEGRVFFNATLQAIATTFKNFRKPDGSLNKAYIARWAGRYASIPFALGFLMPVINYGLEAAFGGGDDDDPYANLPDWVRRNNICLYVGGNNFITIPVGQELAAFLALGDIAAGVTYKPELLPVDKDWTDEVMSVLNTFSPIEIEQKVTEGGLFSKDWLSEAIGKVFSVITPIISVQHNRSWTGRMIYRADKNERDKWTPEYQKAYSGTNPVLMTAAKELHELGGGTDKKRGAEWSEWNPGVLQYLWEQYTGGPGKTLSGIISTGRDAIEFGKQLAGKEGAPEFNIRKIEGVKAFIQQGDERTQFYRTKAKFSKYEREAKRYLYENNITELEKRAEKNDPEAILELGNLKKGADFTRADIIREANHQDKRKGKIGLDDFRSEMYKMTGKERKEAEKWYNKQVKELVNKLDSVRDE